MGARRLNRLFDLFRTGVFCASVVAFVACGDDSSSTDAPEAYDSSFNRTELSDSLSSQPVSSSSSWMSRFSSSSLLLRDSLVKVDSVRDTATNSKTLYPISRLAIDARLSQMYGVSSNTRVKVEALDAENGYAVIQADSGEFVGYTSTSMESPYVKVSVSGVAMNFPKESAVPSVSLCAFGDLSSEDFVEVSFLSSAKLPRVSTLLAAGQSPAVAMEQAEMEILRAFHMDEFSDLPGEEEDARIVAIHLLASALVAKENGFSFDSIANDIADDGLWNDSAARAKIADWAVAEDAEDGFAGIRKALTPQRKTAVPEFEKFMRVFYQKELGLPECAEENVGTMLHVGNPASAYFVLDDNDYSEVKDRFACIEEGKIGFADDTMKDTYGFGVGQDGDVRVGLLSGNLYYTYDASRKAWRKATALEKDSYFIENSETDTFVDIQDVYENIKPNERVIFVLRHAERGDDTSKSGTLTSNGKSQSSDVGKRLTKFEEDFVLGASEFLRAHQTVEYIARGRGQQYEVRDTFPELNDDWYVKDKEESDKAKDECGGGWESTSKYAYTGAYTTGANPAFYKLDERSVELIEDVLLAKYSDPSQRFVLLSSHDKVMVPLVVYCTNFKANLRKYSGGKWLNYLAGIAIIVDELGNRRYIPVKSLDSAYM